MSTEASTASLLALPDELLLDSLGRLDIHDNKSFHALSLTCRRLHKIAAPLLFRNVVLTSENARRMARTLEARPDYAQGVRSLVFRVCQEDQYTGLRDYYAIELMRESLSRCVALEELTYEPGLFAARDDLFDCISSMEHLRSITCPSETVSSRTFPPGTEIKAITMIESPYQALRHITLFNSFPLLKEFHVRDHNSNPYGTYWRQWQMFPFVTLFTMDAMDSEEMDEMMEVGRGLIRTIEAELNDLRTGPHFLNARFELDRKVKNRSFSSPPTLKVTSRSLYPDCRKADLKLLRTLNVDRTTLLGHLVFTSGSKDLSFTSISHVICFKLDHGALLESFWDWLPDSEEGMSDEKWVAFAKEQVVKSASETQDSSIDGLFSKLGMRGASVNQFHVSRLICGDREMEGFTFSF